MQFFYITRSNNDITNKLKLGYFNKINVCSVAKFVQVEVSVILAYIVQIQHEITHLWIVLC